MSATISPYIHIAYIYSPIPDGCLLPKLLIDPWYFVVIAMYINYMTCLAKDLICAQVIIYVIIMLCDIHQPIGLYHCPLMRQVVR